MQLACYMIFYVTDFGVVFIYWKQGTIENIIYLFFPGRYIHQA